ncbi:transmembrane protein, putative [Bodo saltans]|uniref:Transmembrane protein, putative n=1 Tax=Bodo saltans TaxID=75058 RepID=A0A0S4JJ03_BODSA|nr:transmembrane protein, putative [Bodo saltans]|eukprot:CUG91451.1 transmembrane protein, putative [Bodo saltans]
MLFAFFFAEQGLMPVEVHSCLGVATRSDEREDVPCIAARGGATTVAAPVAAASHAEGISSPCATAGDAAVPLRSSSDVIADRRTHTTSLVTIADMDSEETTNRPKHVVVPLGQRCVQCVRAFVSICISMLVGFYLGHLVLYAKKH